MVAENKSPYEMILKTVDKHIERFNATAKSRYHLRKKTTDVVDPKPDTNITDAIF